MVFLKDAGDKRLSVTEVCDQMLMTFALIKARWEESDMYAVNQMIDAIKEDDERSAMGALNSICHGGHHSINITWGNVTEDCYIYENGDGVYVLPVAVTRNMIKSVLGNKVDDAGNQIILNLIWPYGGEEIITSGCRECIIDYIWSNLDEDYSVMEIIPCDDDTWEVIKMKDYNQCYCEKHDRQ